MKNGVQINPDGTYTVIALGDHEGAILDFNDIAFAYAAYAHYAKLLGIDPLVEIEMPKEEWSKHIEDTVYLFTIHQRPLAKSNMYRAKPLGPKRAAIYTTNEMKDYQIRIGEEVKKIIPKTLTGLHSIYVRCYSVDAESKLYDIDNPLKAVLDSTESTKKIKNGKKEIFICEGSGIDNDKHYQLAIGERVFVKTKEEERIEVLIAPYRGLLDFAMTITSVYQEEGLHG